MRNLAFALGIGVAFFAALYVPGILHLGEAVVPAVLALVIAYFLRARRTFKQVEGIFSDAAKALQSMPPKFELAIATMEKAYVFAPAQIGVRTQVDAQIGVMYFLQQEFNKALPYLSRSLGFGHWLGGAMLAVIYYKKKDHAQMQQTFAVVLKRGKKQALVWCLYAYLLMQIGQRERAQSVLVEGLRKTGGDVKVQEALLAVQNGRKIKMKGFKEQWYQFHLERPPVEYQQVALGGRLGKIARRGRW